MEEVYHLRSTNGTAYVVLGSVAKQSRTLKNLIEDTCCAPSSREAPILVPGIPSAVLLWVFAYCAQPEAERTDEWCTAFMEDKDVRDQLKLLEAANYLDIPELQALCSRTLVDSWIGASIPEVRKALGAPVEMSKERRKELERDVMWRDLYQ